MHYTHSNSSWCDDTALNKIECTAQIWKWEVKAKSVSSIMVNVIASALVILSEAPIPTFSSRSAHIVLNGDF